MSDADLLSVRPDRCVRALRTAVHSPGLPQPFDPAGLAVPSPGGSVIISQAEFDGAEWLHASIARHDRMPDYADLPVLKDAVFGARREAYQVFPTTDRHVSIHDQALHVSGRADGRRVLLDFGFTGSI